MNNQELKMEIRFTKSEDLLAFLDRLAMIKSHSKSNETWNKIEEVKAAAINRFLESINLRPRQKTAVGQTSQAQQHRKNTVEKKKIKPTNKGR